jgi:hypothetical protein
MKRMAAYRLARTINPRVSVYRLWSSPVDDEWQAGRHA